MGQEKENAQGGEREIKEPKKIEIESKAGTFVVIVSGTQEEPRIFVEPFFVGGKVKVQGKATIQRWKCLQEGLWIPAGKGIYIQCPEGIARLREEISKLPLKKYWARKVRETVYADGDNIVVDTWEFDCGCWTEKGTLISDSVMGQFLDEKAITEIEISEAAKMWADEQEKAHIKANEEGDRRAQAIFGDDKADAGYWQACENAGIPKFLR